jgi:hypothetical protein
MMASAMENPLSNPTAKSKSGVLYSSVYNGLNVLYPPSSYKARNAESRKDGYWPFMQQGLEPQTACVYGEFDFYFFAELLDRAHGLFYDGHEGNQEMPQPDWSNKVFVDLGSGTGRLVVGAAALHPGWKVCRGIELLEGIHILANDIVRSCSPERELGDGKAETEIKLEASLISTVRDADWLDQLKHAFHPNDTDVTTNRSDADFSNEPGPDDGQTKNRVSFLPNSDPSLEPLPLAPIELTLGSFEDPYIYFGDADCIFCFSTAMPDETLEIISKAIGQQCKKGTIVITTDYPLPLKGFVDPVEDDPAVPHGSYQLEIIDQVEGWCWLVGGESTAYIHRVVESMWKEDASKMKIPISLEDQAYKVVKALESGELTDYKRFALNVHNDMVFNGLPESWLPKLDNQ